MSIAWSAFSPWSALLGGSLIGLGATVLWLGNRRVAGISGIAAGLLSPRGWSVWRFAFLFGLLASPWLLGAFWPVAWLGLHPAPGPLRLDQNDWLLLLLAGLLVGLGTRLANGCTSGHGVCGLARLSGRSLVAVLAFMVSGFATVFVMRHLQAVWA